MKILIISIIFLFIVLFPDSSQAQEKYRVAYVNNLDSVYSHVYWGVTAFARKSTYLDIDLRDDYDQIIKHRFNNTDYEILNSRMPPEYTWLEGYKNMVGGPNQILKNWFSVLEKDYSIDFVIIVDETHVDPNSGFTFINGRSYGTVCKSPLNTQISAFLLDRILIFSTKPPRTIDDFESINPIIPTNIYKIARTKNDLDENDLNFTTYYIKQSMGENAMKMKGTIDNYLKEQKLKNK